ncbi:receptor-like protein kinase ANXUR1 [Malus sylvestris]|uniref:receptor-like protein kinase ANXUR1 n=1 Tax=Malus sylvestris TaxID=3752 RepID=UPI0021AD096B|nr:receptor-like protein kinase ANXUR1 [Malus sylvestris]
MAPTLELLLPLGSHVASHGPFDLNDSLNWTVRFATLTEKSDVYSFGVVLWEVLCARPSLMHTVVARQISLAEWAKSCHGDGTLGQIIVPNVKGKIEVECLNKFIEIVISCLNDKGIERLSMNDVVRGLELVLQLHQKSIGSEGDNGVAFINDRGDNEYSK